MKNLMTAQDPQQPLLTFPCEFPMKVMGRREDGFAQLVSEIVLRHAPDFDPATMEMRSSKQSSPESSDSKVPDGLAAPLT